MGAQHRSSSMKLSPDHVVILAICGGRRSEHLTEQAHHMLVNAVPCSPITRERVYDEREAAGRHRRDRGAGRVCATRHPAWMRVLRRRSSPTATAHELFRTSLAADNEVPTDTLVARA